MDFVKNTINRIIKAFNLDQFNYEIAGFYVSIIIGAFLIELVFVGWNKSSVNRVIRFDKTIRTDLISWFLEVFNLVKIISFILSFGICYYLVGLIQKSLDLKLILYIENYYLQFAIIFIIGDLKNYFRHLVFHKITPLWKLHEFHHSATTLNIFTRYRGHFLESSISTFFDVIPLIIFGVPIQTFLAVKIFTEMHQVLIHSSIKSNWGFIGNYILVSPAAHRLHHSVKSDHYLKNMGTTLIIWDRLFGTYHPYEKIDEVGLPENQYNKKGYLFDVIIGIKNFFKVIINDIKSLFASKQRN